MEQRHVVEGQEPESTMQATEMTTPDAGYETLLRAPVVRPDAVARARRLLASPSWCRAEEVADRLVTCFVGRRLP